MDVQQSIGSCMVCSKLLLSLCNVASIMEVDEYLQSNFKVYEAAPHSERKEPSKNPPPDYFL